MLDVVRSLHRPCTALLERARGARVGAQAPAAGRGDVDGVADDGVAERELPRGRHRPHQRLREQLVQRGQGGGLRELRHRGGQAGLERIADHCRRIEHGARRGCQCRQLGGERPRDRRGQAVIGCRAARCAAHARELLEVERVAPALREDPRGDITHELGRLGAGQRRERQRGDPILGERARERRRERSRQPPLARRECQEHRRRGRSAHERGKRIDRCRIGPVHVVEAEDQPAPGREPLQQLAQRPVHAVAIGQHAGIGEVEPIGPVQLVSECLGEERVGQVGLELRRTRREHGGPLRARNLRQVREQSRLADSRLALEQDGPAGPRAELVERARERVALRGTPDQCRRRGGGHDRDSPT